MGLGPPACHHCHVYAYLSARHGWHCKYCGETNLPHNAWDYKPGILEENERVLKFLKGEDPNASTRTRS